MCTKAKSSKYPRVKTLVEDYPNAVFNSLLGSSITNRNVVILNNHNIVMRKDYKTLKGKVKIIGGGGAGIDPAEINFIGKGMLTAAVLGEMYAAPPAEEILFAIQELASDSLDGILLLVKNYVGDKLNFGMAMSKASSEGILIRMLVLGDDASESAINKHGKKGSPGTILMYKIAGEMAEQDKSLDDIVNECNTIISNLTTVSLALPACGRTFSESLGPFIEPDEMVLGMGVYGQHGNKKIKFCTVIDAVGAVLGEFQHFLNPPDEPSKCCDVVVLVNNYGSIKKFEENIIVFEVSKQLSQSGVNVVLLYAGTFMSGFNTHGFSITMLKIVSPKILKYLEAPTTAPAWPKPHFDVLNDKEGLSPVYPIVVKPDRSCVQTNETKICEVSIGPKISAKTAAALKQTIILVADALISCEKQLNIIDSEAGDGDIGTNLRKGAESLKARLMNFESDITYPSKLLYNISETCSKSMGGVSGALYAVFFSSAAEVFKNSTEITPEVCCQAFKSAVEAMKTFGNSELGDRTVVDALSPAVDSFESAIANGKDLVEALYLTAATCEFKSEETKLLTPQWQKDMGVRTSLLYPDAGAHVATIWLRALSEGLKLTYLNQC